MTYIMSDQLYITLIDLAIRVTHQLASHVYYCSQMFGLNGSYVTVEAIQTLQCLISHEHLTKNESSSGWALVSHFCKSNSVLVGA